MEIKRSGSQPSGKGPADWFTGTVRIDPLFQAPDPARARRQRHIRAGRPDGLAHASARPDADRHGRLRLGAALGRADRGNPARRRGLVPARREALARRHADHGDDAHRHSGRARRQGGRLDGTGQRRTIPGLIWRLNARFAKRNRAAMRWRKATRYEIEELVMKISFENKVALVTGAASGLGLATAKAFAEAGASVASGRLRWSLALPVPQSHELERARLQNARYPLRCG